MCFINTQTQTNIDSCYKYQKNNEGYHVRSMANLEPTDIQQIGTVAALDNIAFVSARVKVEQNNYATQDSQKGTNSDQ